MGVFLSKPETSKETLEGNSGWLRFGAAGMQGWRMEMEDAHACIPDVRAVYKNGETHPGEDRISLFSVFDGHGGHEVAKYAANHVGEVLCQQPDYQSGKFSSALEQCYLKLDEGLHTDDGKKEFLVYASEKQNKGSGASKMTTNDLLRQIMEQIQEQTGAKLKIQGLDEEEEKEGTSTNEEEAKEPTESEEKENVEPPTITPEMVANATVTGGCTAVSALLCGNKLYVANAGDSRCVLSRAGTAVAMSEDHKPNDPIELNRIQSAGGYVEAGRVCGNLNLSRCIGDFEFKKDPNLDPKNQILTCWPDIRMEEITPSDEFIILACDGIWDVLSNQQAVDFVRERLLNKETNQINLDADLVQIATECLDHCLAPETKPPGLGCDNMTLIIVLLEENIKKHSIASTP